MIVKELGRGHLEAVERSPVRIFGPGEELLIPGRPPAPEIRRIVNPDCCVISGSTGQEGKNGNFPFHHHLGNLSPGEGVTEEFPAPSPGEG